MIEIKVIKGTKKCSVCGEMVDTDRFGEEGMTWNNYGRKGWNVDHIKPKINYKKAS